MSQITKGEDRSFTITMRGLRSDGTVGDPIDLTGKTVTLKYRDEANTLQTVSCTVENAVLGRIHVAFTDTQSNTLKAGDFKFDIHVVEGSSEQIYPISNKIVVRARNA